MVPKYSCSNVKAAHLWKRSSSQVPVDEGCSFHKNIYAQINTKEHGPLSTARPEIAYPWKQVYGLTQGKTGMKKHERITCLHQSSSGPSPICTTQFLRGWSKLHLWSECSWFTINLCCLVDGCIFSYCFKRVEISSRLSWHRSRSL